MTLLDNWKDVLTRAWSVRLMALAGLAEALLEFVPYFDFLPRWVVGLLIAGALASRFVAQTGLSKPAEKEPNYDAAL